MSLLRSILPSGLFGPTRGQLASEIQAILLDIDGFVGTTGLGHFNTLSEDTLQIALASARSTQICRSCSACPGNHKILARPPLSSVCCLALSADTP